MSYCQVKRMQGAECIIYATIFGNKERKISIPIYLSTYHLSNLKWLISQNETQEG